MNIPGWRIQDRAWASGRWALKPIVLVISRSGVSPNLLSVLGLTLSLVAAWWLATGRFRWAGAMLLAAGLWDVLDGEVARRLGRATRFGALLDSTVDRSSDLAIFSGLLIYYLPIRPVVGLLAIAGGAGAYLTSYVRARSEGLGIDCRIGLIQRPERIALLVLGALSGPRYCPLFLAALTILAWITVSQRIYHVWTQPNAHTSVISSHGEEDVNA